MSTNERLWRPCRNCGCTHENPQSSSLCESCGVQQQRNNEELKQQNEDNAFELFMAQPKRDRWRILWEKAGRPNS